MGLALAPSHRSAETSPPPAFMMSDDGNDHPSSPCTPPPPPEDGVVNADDELGMMSVFAPSRTSSSPKQSRSQSLPPFPVQQGTSPAPHQHHMPSHVSAPRAHDNTRKHAHHDQEFTQSGELAAVRGSENVGPRRPTGEVTTDGQWPSAATCSNSEFDFMVLW